MRALVQHTSQQTRNSPNGVDFLLKNWLIGYQISPTTSPQYPTNTITLHTQLYKNATIVLLMDWVYTKTNEQCSHK
jgi:hypothetical protein